MTDPFDERFADRVREAFDAYEEPVDEGALERMWAALGHAGGGAPVRGGDRPPVVHDGLRPLGGRARRYGLVAFAAVLLAGGAWLWATQTAPPPTTGRSGVAVAPDPVRSPGLNTAPGVVQRTERPDAARSGEREPGGGGIVERPDAGSAGPLAAASPAVERRREQRDSRSGPGRVSAPAEPPQTEGPRGVDAGAPPPPPIARVDPEGPVSPDGEPSPAAPDVEASVFVAGSPAFVSVLPDPLPELSEPRRSGVRLVVTTAAAFSGRQLAEGAGVATGLAREWAVGRGVSVSGGALAAYGRFVVEPQGATADAFPELEEAPGASIDVTTRSTRTTLALEVPLDVAVDLARTAGGRVRLGFGVTSALYMVQTSEDEGQTHTRLPLGGVTSSPFVERETAPPLGRLDLGRQLNLSLGYTATGGALPLGIDVYARLPLGGVTGGDLPLTAVGLRLRYALP